MSITKRPIVFWVIVAFLALSVVLMLMGQTMAVFNYDRAVQMGLQESSAEVGEYGVQVNRAFGASDTVVYVPLMLVSLVGLILRKRWSLLTTAAVAGVSAYWSVTIVFCLLFLRSVPGYNYLPGPEIWFFVGVYLIVGIIGLLYLPLRADKLLH